MKYKFTKKIEPELSFAKQFVDTFTRQARGDHQIC